MKLSILAGNPKVELIEGQVQIDPQLPAFEEAMKLAQECRDRIAKIAIAFDHKALFRNQFVGYELSNRRMKHLRLADLKPEIVSVYEEAAADYGVNLSGISVISEDICRAKVVQQTGYKINPTDMSGFAFTERGQKCNEEACDKSDDKSDLKVNCRGITAAIIHSLSKDTDEIQTFWVYDPVRVKPETISQGTVLARDLFGVKIPIQQTLIFNGKKFVTKFN
ncbi:MAG: hypothetical protein AAB836_01565 [Patescibacteria group bacterium]